MIAWILTACALLVCAAFVAGIFTGAWFVRRFREVVTHEVPKIVEVEKIVVHDKPVVVQVPVAKKPDQGGLVAMGQPNKHMITDPVQREQFERTQSLLTNLEGPEGGVL